MTEAERMAKNDLQEIIQRLFPHRPVGSLVTYETQSHNGLFTSRCCIFGRYHEGGPRGTKKDAEKSSALVALQDYRRDPKKYQTASETFTATTTPDVFKNVPASTPAPAYPFYHTVGPTATTPHHMLQQGHQVQFTGMPQFPPKVSYVTNAEHTAKADLQSAIQKKYPTAPLNSMLAFKVRETPGGTYVADCSVLGVEYTGDPRPGVREAEQSSALVALIDFRDAFPDEEGVAVPTKTAMPTTDTIGGYTLSRAERRERAQQKYDEITTPSYDLPLGWERVSRGQSFVYLDHVGREAHAEPPWDVWQRKHTSYIVQAVTKVGRMK